MSMQAMPVYNARVHNRCVHGRWLHGTLHVVLDIMMCITGCGLCTVMPLMNSIGQINKDQ